ncbi:serine/threonine protein kinase, partial [Pseudomonas syringae pv. actinidiae]|nr:serine/threonine protein kinase [Pseudomonas syringae pv. actinidiae]
FLKRALQCDFYCYLTEQVIPMWRARTDGGSLLQLMDQVSLYALKDYLHSNTKIAVMHNADDVILGAGDLGFLRKTFGDRLTVYPYGGHCGNLNYRVNTDAMLEFFRG